MHLNGLVLTVLWASSWLCAVGHEVPDLVPVRNVAVIGAGAAGSSTAYYLRRYADEHGLGVNITLFEKTDRIGGRTLTINSYGDPNIHVELGASIFVEVNAILYNATKEFGLEPSSPYEKGLKSTSSKNKEDKDEIMAIWDGDRIRFSINESHSSWWTSARLVWRYGFFALRNAQKLMHKTIGKFLNMYNEPHFPFQSLTETAQNLGLLEETSVTGEEFLRKNKIPELLSHEFIQAMTRVNYASNLANIHGLDTMVATAPEGAMSIAGGNWQIFDRMVKASGARVLRNTSVTQVAKDPSSSSGPYYITTSDSHGSAKEDSGIASFDDVVIATPYQFSNMKVMSIDPVIDKIPYVQLHVTIFASPHRLSAAYFKVSPSEVPTMVLTTLPEGADPNSGSEGAGKAGFFSISTLRTLDNPKTGQEEYLYKIFSPKSVTPGFLSDILGVSIPDTFDTGEFQPHGTGQGTEDAEPISWYYTHVFNSYPKAFPRVTFQDPVLADGLYYTSGMESFISTMETNALMGMNVAKLIVDDMLGAAKEEVNFSNSDGR